MKRWVCSMFVLEISKLIDCNLLRWRQWKICTLPNPRNNQLCSFIFSVCEACALCILHAPSSPFYLETKTSKINKSWLEVCKSSGRHTVSYKSMRAFNHHFRISLKMHRGISSVAFVVMVHIRHKWTVASSVSLAFQNGNKKWKMEGDRERQFIVLAVDMRPIVRCLSQSGAPTSIAVHSFCKWQCSPLATSETISIYAPHKPDKWLLAVFLHRRLIDVAVSNDLPFHRVVQIQIHSQISTTCAGVLLLVCVCACCQFHF